MSRKRNGEQELPRTEWTYGHATQETSRLTITLDPSGRIHIPEIDPTTIRRQITHTRTNKDDKVLFSSPADDFGQTLEPTEQLKSKFDFILAVDTNTIRDKNGPMRFNGYTASACTIVTINEPTHEWGTEIRFQPLASYLILDAGEKVQAEQLGWHLALTRHTNTAFLRSKRLGMIVDCELGKHIDINSQAEPYHGVHLLPDNTKLIYASSDRSATFANSMLKCCDNIAGQMLDHFKRLGIESALSATRFQIDTARCFSICHISNPLKQR